MSICKYMCKHNYINALLKKTVNYVKRLLVKRQVINILLTINQKVVEIFLLKINN